MIDRYYIGGSSCAAAAGLSPYTSRYDLWHKLKHPDAAPQVANRYTYWGTVLEMPIRCHYGIAHGVGIATDEIFGNRTHPSHAWARGTPDGIVTDVNGVVWGLEIKTAGAKQSSKWGRSGGKKVPIQYKAQCYWYMWITGLRRWDLAVLIDGSDYREFQLDWDPKFGDKLIADCIEFWEKYVLADVAPPRDHQPLPVQTAEEQLAELELTRLAIAALSQRATTQEQKLGAAIDTEGDDWNLDILAAMCGYNRG